MILRISAIVIAPLEFQNLNVTSCITVCVIIHTNDTAFNQKEIKKNGFLKVLCLITQKNDFKLPENVKTENDPWCL